MPLCCSQQHALSQPRSAFLIISETWNTANPWITKHKAKCGSCMRICLIGEKGKHTSCFLKKLRIAVHYGRPYKTVDFGKIKRQI